MKTSYVATILLLLVSVVHCYDFIFEPTLVNDNYQGTQLKLYKYCETVNLQPFSSPVVQFSVVGTKSNYVAFDWGTTAPGLDFIITSPSRNVTLNLQVGDSLYNNWRSIFDSETSNPTFDGYILTQGSISSLILTVGGKDLEFTSNYESVCHKSCPAEDLDSCSVCGGDGSSCTYPIDCDGLPGILPCDSSSSQVIADNGPVDMFTRGSVSVLFALIALIPVVIAAGITCCLLERDRKKRKQQTLEELITPTIHLQLVEMKEI